MTIFILMKRHLKLYISVEPDPDNSTNPFAIKPLLGMIPQTAVDHVTYMMQSNLGSLPSGTAMR